MTNPASALIFGKFTQFNVATEFMGDILAGHDWGMGQPHIPSPPVTASPSIGLCTFGAGHKYWMPSYAVQETPAGGAISLIGASGSAVAITTPVFNISIQDCIDVGGANVGLVAPLGMGIQVPSCRWVGFTWSDLGAGLISMAGDALSAGVGSHLGGKLTDGLSNVAGAIVGGLVNTANGVLQNIMGAVLPNDAGGNITAAAVGGTAILGASGAFGAPAGIGLVAGRAADAVGGAERPGDTGTVE
ncbi:MAG: hypothetical protein ABIF09_09665 [Gemmatimonadota bacterium]